MSIQPHPGYRRALVSVLVTPVHGGDYPAVMYVERASRLPDTVVWSRTVSPHSTTIRVLPDGCLDLMWVGGRLVVAGPDTSVQLASSAAGERFVALRFAHGAGPRILGVPASELVDTRVRLAQLWPGAEVRRLTERMAEARDPAAVLESIAADRLRRHGPPDPVAGAIAARLRAGDSVAATADAVSLSARHLHRRCQDLFGYGPKTLARVLRLERALAMARAGTPFATVAATAGYADQAHLAREVKSLAGVPLRVLTS
jgi:AraC-like DNA-binding protein